MSDTPRTDALHEQWVKFWNIEEEWGEDMPGNGKPEIPMPDLARQLERENAAIREELANQERKLRKQFDRELGCELRDPYGTIWEQCQGQQQEIDKLRNDLADAHENNLIIHEDNVDLTNQLIEVQRSLKDAHENNTSLLYLLADIRGAAGDSECKLMQAELIEHIAELREGHRLDCERTAEVLRELHELRKDKERLDALERIVERKRGLDGVVFLHDWEDGFFIAAWDEHCQMRVMWPNDDSWQKHESVRASIDAAMNSSRKHEQPGDGKQ